MAIVASTGLSFTLNPFAYERRTIEQLEPFRFASTEKPYRFHIQIGDLREVERGGPGTIAQFRRERIQVSGSNSADQSNRRSGIITGFLNPQCHGTAVSKRSAYCKPLKGRVSPKAFPLRFEKMPRIGRAGTC